ncbi:MAG: S1C family serine protease [Bacteroidia bacterium]
MKRILGAFSMAVLGGGVALGLQHILFTVNNSSSNTNDPNIPVKLAGLNGKGTTNTLPDFRISASQSVKSVVHVKTKFTSQISANDPISQFFFGHGGQMPSQQQQASGSGVIISNDGYIVTNNHVVEQADEIEVTLDDKRTYTAKLIGTDPNTDLAVLKIEEKDLPYILYGNSDNVLVGEWVLAVGNPFNLTSTVTAGIVSAKARNINLIAENGSGPGAVESFIQTDAAVNPGNSGGALVNTAGELVGINTGIASQTGTFSGYSFAIPSNLVKKVVTDLVEYGTVQRGYLGVNIRDLNADLAKEKGINELNGVYVAGVLEDGAAEAAGMREGDVILQVGDVVVNNTSELQEQVNNFRPGDKVEVTYQRDNKSRKATVMLRNKNNAARLLDKEEVSETTQSLGATFESVATEDLRKLGLKNGLRVKKLAAGKLKNAGMNEGFIITSVD